MGSRSVSANQPLMGASKLLLHCVVSKFLRPNMLEHLSQTRCSELVELGPFVSICEAFERNQEFLECGKLLCAPLFEDRLALVLVQADGGSQ